jgi:hypothetical protein
MQDRKRTCRKATILPNTLKQMKRLLNIHPLLDSQAVKVEGACLVWCVRWIQRLCKAKLKIPPMKMANQKMREQRLEFAKD